jgi:hypothetical protein
MVNNNKTIFGTFNYMDDLHVENAVLVAVIPNHS